MRLPFWRLIPAARPDNTKKTGTGETQRGVENPCGGERAVCDGFKAEDAERVLEDHTGCGHPSRGD